MESTIASINAETTNFELKTANAIWPALLINLFSYLKLLF